MFTPCRLYVVGLTGNECSHDSSPGMRVWDQISVVLLFIVAILTPYEVAFMTLELDFWFWFNRIIDLAFFVDMIL